MFPREIQYQGLVPEIGTDLQFGHFEMLCQPFILNVVRSQLEKSIVAQEQWWPSGGQMDNALMAGSDVGRGRSKDELNPGAVLHRDASRDWPQDNNAV